MKAERIDLGEFDAERFGGEWVDLKPFRTLGDDKQIETAGIVLGGAAMVDGELVPTIAKLDIIEQEIAPLLVSITAWSLRDEDSQPIAVDREGVLGLHADLGAWLLKRIEAFYSGQERGAGEGKTSAESSTAPLRAVESPAS